MILILILIFERMKKERCGRVSLPNFALGMDNAWSILVVGIINQQFRIIKVLKFII